MDRNTGKKPIKDDSSTHSAASALLNRPSLASRLTAGNIEVKGISRKEFKPTIPTRRKKHAVLNKLDNQHPEGSETTDFKQKLKYRLEGNSKFAKPGVDQKKGRGRKEFVRSSTGLFGSGDQKLDGDDPFSSARTAAELEEEKYVDPFHQSTNELTPVTLPINPRIDSRSKLLVGKDTAATGEAQETTVSELLYRAADDVSESTYVFNMPDLLPVNMSKLAVSAEPKDPEAPAPELTPSIHSLPEGYLGRLQILKSGRARLVIGEVPFDVSLNSKSGFLQEILCCQTQALDRGIIANLGSAPYSLSVSPEFDKLIT